MQLITNKAQAGRVRTGEGCRRRQAAILSEKLLLLYILKILSILRKSYLKLRKYRNFSLERVIYEPSLSKRGMHLLIPDPNRPIIALIHLDSQPNRLHFLRTIALQIWERQIPLY